MIQENLLTTLLADASVSDIVGTKIFPLRIPQGTALPAAVYQRINVDPVVSMDGDSRLDNIRIQITSWANTYEEALDLADAIRQAIMADATLKSITAGENDTEDPETKAYGVVTDFYLWAELAEIVPPVLEFLLLESGDAFLLESGDKLALEEV